PPGAAPSARQLCVVAGGLGAVASVLWSARNDRLLHRTAGKSATELPGGLLGAVPWG
ncbi:hypothetical protein STRIP9103_07145, partial [Streptomyces ipomoeae 91-03]